MRTYTRKRPQYEEIEGVKDLCRLCLGKTEVPVPIFTEDSENMCATLPLRIMICVGLEMTRDEYLPNAICDDCYKELERYYTFRKKCEMTYQKLKSHVLAVKERMYNKAMAVKFESHQMEVPQAAVVDPDQHLLMTLKDKQQGDVVNMPNLDSVHLDNIQELQLERVKETSELKKQNNDVQMQDITTTNPAITTQEFQASTSDLTLIMSTMLIELGVLQQEERGLVLADETLKMVELEGDDGTKIVLRLMEEDDELSPNTEVPENIPALPNLLETPKNADILPIPKAPEVSSNKESVAKYKDTTCGECGKQLASRSALARHARVHSGERPHACRACGRRFAQRAVMLRHELVHAATRPFKCSSCPKSFTQQGTLVAHARTHQLPALALHACPSCDKLFLYASGLSRHMGVHTGRVHACGACARVFRDASSLRRHARLAHAPPPGLPALRPKADPAE